jgi:hypothetical protein
MDCPCGKDEMSYCWRSELCSLREREFEFKQFGRDITR